MLKKYLIYLIHKHFQKRTEQSDSIMSEEQLWDPGQEWIQIFDNLLKHPQE